MKFQAPTGSFHPDSVVLGTINRAGEVTSIQIEQIFENPIEAEEQSILLHLSVILESVLQPGEKASVSVIQRLPRAVGRFKGVHTGPLQSGYVTKLQVDVYTDHIGNNETRSQWVFINFVDNRKTLESYNNDGFGIGGHIEKLENTDRFYIGYDDYYRLL